MKNETFPYSTRNSVGEWIEQEITTVEWLKMLKQQAIGWYGDEIGRLYDKFAERCEEFSSGRNRAVFIFSTYVVKLPTCGDGGSDNDWEGSICGSGDYIQYARTRLAYWKEIPIVFMERVKHASTNELIEKLGKEPDWTYCVDCGQVGWNRQGKLVAYDFGIR